LTEIGWRCPRWCALKRGLLIEWPEDETEPTKYWFSTLPEDAGDHVLTESAQH
jgi:hypothetical protein